MIERTASATLFWRPLAALGAFALFLPLVFVVGWGWWLALPPILANVLLIIALGGT